MALRRPPNKSGIFLGGVGGSIGRNGEGVGLERLAKRIGAEREKQARIAVRKTEEKPSGFFENLAEDIGLEDFYERDVIPVMGRVFGEAFRSAKETYGLSLASPLVAVGRGVATATDNEKPIDDGFDYAADAVRAGAGIVKTKGWEPAKKYVAPAIDKGTKIAGQSIDAFSDAVKRTDKEIESSVPQYAIVKNWADRRAIEPVKDIAAEAITRIAGQPVNKRIDAADDIDRNYIYASNDITQRGSERATAATPAMRERWIRMATGQYGHPAWEGYESPFSVEQLQGMSDYELVNAAYGTHTNAIASLFEAAKNDFKKISSMPAALNVFSDQILDAEKRGDWRGLGNMAEFLARQAASTVMAVNSASLYAATGGQAGDYEPLVRALKTEPILTTLDAASTATVYGKGATIALKTGGAATKAGALASRVPGAVRAGSAIARGAETAAAIPVAGAPLRVAAATGRGLRKIADVERVEVRDPTLQMVAEAVGGSDVMPTRVFKPSSSIFSKAAALLRKELYTRSSPILRRAEASDARIRRAIESSVIDTVDSDMRAPVIKALTDIYNESPDLALRVVWDLSNPTTIKKSDELGGGVVEFSPGRLADQLEDVLAGKLWEKVSSTGDKEQRFSEASPGPEWKQIVTQKPKTGKSTVRYLNAEKVSALQQQIELLRRIDALPPEVVARSREVLDTPYAQQFGPIVGRRIGGRNAPDATLRQFIGRQEMGDEQLVGNIPALSALGVEGSARIYDAPQALDVDVRGALGIPKRESGVTRRIKGMELLARLQDSAIAQMTYTLGPELRKRAEAIIDDKKSTLAEKIDAQNKLIEEIQAELSGFEAQSEQAKAALTLARQKVMAEEAALEQAQGGASQIPPAAPAQAKAVIQKQKASGIIGSVQRAKEKIKSLLGGKGKKPEDNVEATIAKISDPQYGIQSAYLPSDSLLVEKVGEAAGSNKGGVTGFWRDDAGVLRYVKEYASPLQAYEEFMANQLYRLLGADTPETVLTDYNGKLLVSTRVIEDGKQFDNLDLTDENAKTILNNVVADALLANWDTVGTNFENLLIGKDGRIWRIDQGGVFRFRAQGELKAGDLAIADVDDFVKKNPFYQKVFEAAGYGGAKDIPNLQQQLDSVMALGAVSRSGWQAILDAISFKALGGRDFNNIFPLLEENESLAMLLSRRLESLQQKHGVDSQSDLTGVQKVVDDLSDEDVLDIGKAILEQYVGESIYRSFNQYLRHGKIPSDPEAYKKRYSLYPAGKTFEERVQFYAGVLERLAKMAPETDEPMVIYRGAKGELGVALQKLQPGEEFVDKGWISATFNNKTAASFANGASQAAPKETQVLLEILLPKGSKAIIPHAMSKTSPDDMYGSTSWGWSESEINLPQGTRYRIVAIYPKGEKDANMVMQVVAITPDAADPGDIPSFGMYGAGQTKQVTSPALEAAKADFAQKSAQAADLTTTVLKKSQEIAKIQARQAEDIASFDELVRVQNDIDLYVESLMRDMLEASDTPGGGTVFMPTLGGTPGAKKSPFAMDALAGRGRKRDLIDIYTGQFAMLGSMQDLEKFSGALARNMRIPFVAYEAVTRFTNYLMRTGTVIKFSTNKAEYEQQIKAFEDAALINNNGQKIDDYVILPIDPNTGFFKKDTFKRIDTEKVEAVGTKGRSDVGVDDAQIAEIMGQAIKQNNIDEIRKIPKGSRVVIISRARYNALIKEFEAAAKNPNLMRRLTRAWVRLTLTTLPRTPIANIVGSGMLSALGGGLGGYREAMRMLRRGDYPPELLNNGFAGMFNDGGNLVVPSEKVRFKAAQRYMNYLYYYNVMGEDLARLSVFIQSVKKDLKNSQLAKQLDEELAQAQELNDAFQTLLEAVAKGEFANGKKLSPELEKIRDDALLKADDFLGGARGLTSQQRFITTYIPFWIWYKHIFKLYFYTLPFKYPGRSLTLNAMARYGAEESARQGYYDTFWEDGIKVGEEIRGPNIYSKALATNIFPFTFGGLLESQEGAPGVAYIASNIAPTVTVPLRIAGIGIPGQPLIGTSGRRVGEGDFFTAQRGETALSELERLIAPVGLLQRYLTPRGSLLLGAGRVATGQDIPQQEQFGKGPSYAVTPRGLEAIGSQAIPEALARAFGVTIERIPIEGPVARRRLREREQTERQTVLEKYKEQRRQRREG